MEEGGCAVLLGIGATERGAATASADFIGRLTYCSSLSLLLSFSREVLLCFPRRHCRVRTVYYRCHWYHVAAIACARWCKCRNLISTIWTLNGHSSRIVIIIMIIFMNGYTSYYDFVKLYIRTRVAAFSLLHPDWGASQTEVEQKLKQKKKKKRNEDAEDGDYNVFLCWAEKYCTNKGAETFGIFVCN